MMQVSAVECGPYDYSRSGNPTRAQLEAHMADLEVPYLVLQLSLFCFLVLLHEADTLHPGSCHPRRLALRQITTVTDRPHEQGMLKWAFA